MQDLDLNPISICSFPISNNLGNLSILGERLKDQELGSPLLLSRIRLSKIGKFARLYQKYRKMVGSNGTMIAIRLVRSKLRKREDHHSSTDAVHPEATVVQTATSPGTIATIATTPAHPDDCRTQISTDIGNGVCNEHVYAATTVTPSANPVEPFAWQFPPPYPPPHVPSAQYTLYNDQVGAPCIYLVFCTCAFLTGFSIPISDARDPKTNRFSLKDQ